MPQPPSSSPPFPPSRADTLARISSLIERDREAILAGWRAKVRELPSAAGLDTPTLNDHVPSLLLEMTAALRSRSDETIAEALRDGSPPIHGIQRVADGYDIEEVVAEYNILRGCIHDAVDAAGLTLQGEPFHLINTVMDSAIGMAVKTFSEQKALEAIQRREEYLAFVAHDMRTPLAAVGLAVRLLEMSAGSTTPSHPPAPPAPPAPSAPAPIAPPQAAPPAAGPSPHTQLLRTIKRNVQHMNALVAKVLQENANLQTGPGMKLERRTFELWPLVEEVTYDLHPVATTGGTRLINAIPDDLTVYADAGLLQRIFQNLIANAIKYTPAGEVTIGAERDTAVSAGDAIGSDATGAAGSTPAGGGGGGGGGGGITCWVKDNGEGIPAAMLHSVFNKGETDTSSEGGLGLGLSIVKSLIEAHGGKVVVSSIEGRGAQFRFNLPDRATSRAPGVDEAEDPKAH